MSVVKIDIPGSNNDIENIIQGYINDLKDMDKHKEKYAPVMNELEMVMHNKPRCAFVSHLNELSLAIGGDVGLYHCKICKQFFSGNTVSHMECVCCKVKCLRDGFLYND